MRRAIALAALAFLVHPVAARADDEPRWNWDEDGPPPVDPQLNDSQPLDYPQPADVDVQVGLSAPGAAVQFDTFHDALAPHGQWVTVSGYGQVWRPGGVPQGWRPYYYGRWEWTNEGWLWVSDEPFGWATYHYGRWASDPYYGWVWVPGYQWAPAWVTWRYSPDYIGWAPLAPGFSVYVSSFPVVFGWWTFVPCHSFVGVPIYRHAYASSHVPGLWGATRPAPPRAAVYGHAAPAWGGPARGVVESRMGRAIAPVRVQPVGSPAAAAVPSRGGAVPVFRPEASRPAAPLAPRREAVPPGNPGVRGTPAAPGVRGAPAAPGVRGSRGDGAPGGAAPGPRPSERRSVGQRATPQGGMPQGGAPAWRGGDRRATWGQAQAQPFMSSRGTAPRYAPPAAPAPRGAVPMQGGGAPRGPAPSGGRGGGQGGGNGGGRADNHGQARPQHR